MDASESVKLPSQVGHRKSKNSETSRTQPTARKGLSFHTWRWGPPLEIDSDYRYYVRKGERCNGHAWNLLGAMRSIGLTATRCLNLKNPTKINEKWREIERETVRGIGNLPGAHSEIDQGLIRDVSIGGVPMSGVTIELGPVPRRSGDLDYF